ncbi:MAG: hypothetical protein J7497_06845 [Chitinophagaceae bacterium]|nr:hypothetical protein [Chitinophagaceae bacterium]
MIVRDNIFLMGVSGRAKNMVVKQYKDKTVITAVPNMKDRVLTAKQKDANDNMKMAIAYAKHITADPKLKSRACQILNVPPNKVFRAIVKEYLLKDGDIDVAEETQKDKEDKQTLDTIKSIILNEIPDAETMLYGSRVAENTPEADWDILILTNTQYPKTLKWELQDKLFGITMKTGSRTNILVVQKTEWLSEDYKMLRNKIGEKIQAF